MIANESRSESRSIYLPEHERAMAHFSYASPDRKSILVVEMDRTGAWQPCRIVPFDGSSTGRQVGPAGACTGAALSPDGAWMYFSTFRADESHLWRQHTAAAEPPQQITFGPTQQEGIAVEPDGGSLITSIGVEQSAIWIHDREVERPVSGEGYASLPRFSRDGKRVFFLRRGSPDGANELWVADVVSGNGERVLPGFSMVSFDMSDDGKQLVFGTSPGQKAQIWLADIEKPSPAKLIASAGEDSPYFGPKGEILFRFSESGKHFLWRMNQDGSRREKVLADAIGTAFSISPDRRWITALSPVNGDNSNAATIALPTEGGIPRRICSGGCIPRWGANGGYLYISIPRQSGATGDLLAVPVKRGETFPPLPPPGIASFADGATLPGARIIEFQAARGRHWESHFAFGPDPSVFAYRNITVHRNLFRIPLHH